MTALATLATAVARATPATPEDKARLQEVEQLLCGEKLMSVSAVARMLASRRRRPSEALSSVAPSLGFARSGFAGRVVRVTVEYKTALR